MNCPQACSLTEPSLKHRVLIDFWVGTHAENQCGEWLDKQMHETCFFLPSNLNSKNNENRNRTPVEYLFDIVLRIGQPVVGTRPAP